MHVKAKVGAGFGTEQMFVLQSINKPLAGDKWKFSTVSEIPSARLFWFLKFFFFFYEASYSGCFLVL